MKGVCLNEFVVGSWTKKLGKELGNAWGQKEAEKTFKKDLRKAYS